MKTSNQLPQRGFFDEVISLANAAFSKGNNIKADPCCFVTTHLLQDRPYFLNAISRVAEIASLTPKPKSIHWNTFRWVETKYDGRIDRLNRSDTSDADLIARLIKSRCGPDRRFMFADVGGYYCKIVKPTRTSFGDRFLGVVEDTENGHQLYEKVVRRRNASVPVISVARSPLKNPEDFLVGQSIVYSVEALLRGRGDILQGRRASVLGYGKIGRGVATALRNRNVETIVYDRDHVPTVEAFSHGFHIASNPREALESAGLVFCATGNYSLSRNEYEFLQDGCYVATATSSDDELDTATLKGAYRRRRVSDHITSFSRRNPPPARTFYFLNHGQAVNFVHGAVVGPFIYLIQGEIIASLVRLKSDEKLPVTQINENSRELREQIAKAWVAAFKLPLPKSPQA